MTFKLDVADQRTSKPPTDTASYRVACTWLKIDQKKDLYPEAFFKKMGYLRVGIYQKMVRVDAGKSLESRKGQGFP